MTRKSFLKTTLPWNHATCWIDAFQTHVSTMGFANKPLMISSVNVKILGKKYYQLNSLTFQELNFNLIGILEPYATHR